MTEPTDEGTAVEVETAAATCPAPCERAWTLSRCLPVVTEMVQVRPGPWGGRAGAATRGPAQASRAGKWSLHPTGAEPLPPTASAGCCCPHQPERLSSCQARGQDKTAGVAAAWPPPLGTCALVPRGSPTPPHGPPGLGGPPPHASPPLGRPPRPAHPRAPPMSVCLCVCASVSPRPARWCRWGCGP